MPRIARKFPLVISQLILITAASAQMLSLGVTGGVPISPHTSTDIHIQPYTVGPVIDLNLPANFALETGVLYQRLNQNINHQLSLRNFVLPYTTHVAANAWLIPALVKYNVGHRTVKPFIKAGATIRFASDLNGNGLQDDINFIPHPATFNFPDTNHPEAAITAGAGLSLHALIFDVAPEIRYLHWTSLYRQPTREQAMLMLTVSFPARK
jgi:hypothetical protein